MWQSILLIVSALLAGAATRSISVEIESCNTEFNRDIMQNVTISLITVGNRKVINGSLITKIDLPSFNLTTTMMLQQNSTSKMTYFNLTMNGCDFFEPSVSNYLLGSVAGNLANLIRNSIKNLPKRCPIKRFTEMVVSNLYVDDNMMPHVMVPTRFEFTIIVSVHSTMAVTTRVDGVLGQERKIIV